MSRDSFCCVWCRVFPRPRDACGGWGCSRVRVCLRAGTSDRCAPAVLSLPPLRGGPSRSRSHGRLRRPKSLPIRHSSAAAQCLTPLGCRACSCFDLLAASIRKSGLEIKNRCKDCPCLGLLATSIRKSWPEIKNRCTDCPCFDLFATSIRKSGLEIKNRCTVCPCFDLLAALIRKSGLEIGNRCTEVPGMMLAVAVIVNSGPEIKNHCSAIVPASRMARLPRT